MIIAPKPENEVGRLKSLERYKVLDTLSEQTFNDITELASTICGTQVALISLIDKDRQWFKAAIGTDVGQTPRDLAFCTHAILQNNVLMVTDASKDERFHDNPIVVGGPQIRFYAGAPLQTTDGYMLGTLCVIDPKPMALSDFQVRSLEALSRQVMCLLELRVNAMDLANASEELEASRDQALRLSASKSAFLANMTHEIRTPMNGIIGMADFLKDSGLTTEQTEYLNGIDSSAKCLLSLVNDVLDSAKIEAGKLDIQHEDFDLEKVLSGVELLFRAETGRKKIRLALDTPDLPYMLKGDALRIRQVLLNFMSNAVKFTTHGHVRLESKIIGVTKERTKIRFEVRDTGMGIAKEKLGSLFNDFVQADASIAKHFGGTGLGLSISRKLVDLMHGAIGAESVAGSGSSFWFEIEFENGERLTKVAAAAPSRILNQFTKSEASNFHVLAVDDNETNRTILSRTLKLLGFQVTLATNGQEAVGALQENKFDLVLMDCQMPIMNGYEATRAIRTSNSHFQNIPIIAATANFSAEVEAATKHVGMDDFLSKPFTREKILDKLAVWLKPDRQTAS